jgi:hypothetical protein
MRGMRIEVEAYAGYRGDESPRRFVLGERAIEVIEILDRWIAPDRRYFKLRADDGGIYILYHDDAEGWGLRLYDSGTRHDTRLSST